MVFRKLLLKGIQELERCVILNLTGHSRVQLAKNKAALKVSISTIEQQLFNDTLQFIEFILFALHTLIPVFYSLLNVVMDCYVKRSMIVVILSVRVSSPSDQALHTFQLPIKSIKYRKHYMFITAKWMGAQP